MSDTGKPPREHRRHSSLKSTWSILRREAWAAIRHQFGCWRARRVKIGGARLNVGSGKHPLVDWINADLFLDADLNFDIRERWPVADGQLRVIRLEHVLEHVEYPGHALHVLCECYRVLQPNGIVRVGVPDTAAILRAYVEGPEAAYFRTARESWHPASVRLPIEHVNFHFRDRYGEHLFAYDAEALEQLLSRAGFSNIQRAGFDPAIDRPDREAGTIRLCGIKITSKESQP